MKPFLLKTLEIVRWLGGVLWTLLRRLLALLSSVNIDQPRGAILAIAFQFILVAALVAGLRATSVGNQQSPAVGRPPVEPPIVLDSSAATSPPAEAGPNGQSKQPE